MSAPEDRSGRVLYLFAASLLALALLSITAGALTSSGKAPLFAVVVGGGLVAFGAGIWIRKIIKAHGKAILAGLAATTTVMALTAILYVL